MDVAGIVWVVKQKLYIGFPAAFIWSILTRYCTSILANTIEHVFHPTLAAVQQLIQKGTPVMFFIT